MRDDRHDERTNTLIGLSGWICSEFALYYLLHWEQDIS